MNPVDGNLPPLASGGVPLSGVQPGDTFLIQIGGFDGQQGMGNLEVDLDPWSQVTALPESFEDNATMSQAVPLALGLDTGRNIEVGDEDWFELTIPHMRDLDA